MKKFLIIILLFGQWQVDAQTIGTDQAVEDLEFLKKSIFDVNPALLYYHPEFDSLSTQLIVKVKKDSVSIFEHFTKISRICAMANEGHFNIGYRNDYLQKSILNNTSYYLPIQVKIISERIFVDADFSNEQLLNRGDEITSINGMQSEIIILKLLELIPSDGSIVTFARRKIEDRFSLLFFFHIQQSDTFKITLVDKNKKEKNIKLKALSRSNQIENIKKFYPKNGSQDFETDRFYTLNFNDSHAYLDLPSFDFRRVNKFEIKSKKLYKAIFQQLQDKNISNLIIDLRDNTGGRNEFSDDMVPYILQENNDDLFLKKTISWNGRTRIYKLPKPSKLAFYGSIFVLVNGKTYSAGSMLARYLKEYGKAKIIGTETGTRYEGFAAGSEETVILPNSGVTIGIPRYHIVFPKSTKQQTINRGLLPDYEIESTFESYSNKIDLHLDKAISIIKKDN